MTVVPYGSLILVTGASGFIASHTIVELLARGFDVRGTVRTAEKGECMKKVFTDVDATTAGKFEYVVVENLTKKNGFDDAVVGVAGILHIASPLYRTAPKGVWENIIEPAKAGTVSVLEAAAKLDSVKRVVITSSLGAVLERSRKPGTIFTEKDWNNEVTEKALSLGDALDPTQAYSASKVWAEKAAWAFMEGSHPTFDLTTILPPLVCGPIIHPVSSPSMLNTSNVHLWGFLTGNPPGDPMLMPGIPVVDVRDIAHAHIEALLRPAAGDKRINISAGVHNYQEFLDVISTDPTLSASFSPRVFNSKVSAESSPHQKYLQNTFDLDASLSVELLEMTYRPLQSMVLDATHSLLDIAKGKLKEGDEEWAVNGSAKTGGDNLWIYQ